MSGNEPTLGRDELVDIVRGAVAPLIAQNNETSDALLRTISEMKTAQELTNERLGVMMKTVENHDHLLRGNGKVGLVTRVESVEGTVDGLKKSLEDVLNALRGSEDKPGLVGRLKQLEERVENLSRPVWIFISALIGAGVTLLFSLLSK